eukprot:jgi/Mesvir1/23877/Mv25233-RA.1
MPPVGAAGPQLCTHQRPRARMHHQHMHAPHESWCSHPQARHDA